MKTLLRKASAALASGDEWELSSSSITRAGVIVPTGLREVFGGGGHEVGDAEGAGKVAFATGDLLPFFMVLEF
jgi:hypothetical protein